MKTYTWIDKDGIEHVIPYGSCVICTHCTDLFLDPLQGNYIYACICELCPEAAWPECGDFKLLSEGIIVEGREDD